MEFNEERIMKSIFADLKFKAKTPKGLAEEIKRVLVQKFKLNAEHVFVWPAQEFRAKGYQHGDDKAWMIAAEEAPYDWAHYLSGWSAAIYEHPSVFTEVYNSYSLVFVAR